MTKNGSRLQVVPFQASDLGELRLQTAQAGIGRYLDRDVAETLEAAGRAFSAVSSGKVIACAGVMEIWSGRLQGWALLSHCGPGKFLQVHRAVMRFLDAHSVQRIETAVDCDFTAGHRWARLLGFRMEAPRMRFFGPGGRDAALYARIRRFET